MGFLLDAEGARAAAAPFAVRLAGIGRVAIVAEPAPWVVAAVLGALDAGCQVVPINPASGEAERAHVLLDARPDVLLADGGQMEELDGGDGGGAAGMIVYTSGTTGPPKGVVLPLDALRANLVAVYDVWAWTERDRVVHALPLSHVHGLLLGTLGPLWRGGSSHHVGRFDPAAIAAGIADTDTLVFGVPTMWSRIAAAIEGDPALASRFAAARLLVSGSAGLPLSQHERLTRLLGRRVIERYGMSETLFTVGERAGTDDPPGSVGRPLPDVELRLADEEQGLGEIEVRAPWLFHGYLGQPAATAASYTADGFFRTGDIARRRPDGCLQILGRADGDLIKTGGYRVGAGEIESCLLDHPAVAEVAVTTEPDDDLGERIVAWVVAREPVTAAELTTHVASLLAPHKRPRDVRFLDALPRNELGKVLKRALRVVDSPEPA